MRAYGRDALRVSFARIFHVALDLDFGPPDDVVSVSLLDVI